MQVEKTYKVKAIPPSPGKPATTRKVSVRICDFCKTRRKYVCTLCDRDLCYEHTLYDDEDWGDYPAKYCKICHDLKYVTYKQARRDMEDEYDNKVEAFEQRIKEESLAL